MGHYERPPTPLAYAGQFSRGVRRMFIMELLGKRGPLTSGDIAKEFLTRKGLNPDDKTLFRRQQEGIHHAQSDEAAGGCDTRGAN